MSGGPEGSPNRTTPESAAGGTSTTKASAASRDVAPPTTVVSERPLLRVVKGDPTPEEIAALVAVIASMSAHETPAARPVSVWADPARGVRTTLPHGLGAWCASGLPR